MSGLISDLRFAVRALRRTPGFALAAVLTLGLGIGATSAVYSVGNGLLWRPLPGPHPEQLALIYAQRGEAAEYQDLTWGDYRDLREGTTAVFQDLTIVTPSPFSVAHGEGAAERVWGEIVGANYFSLLGMAPSLGRGFVPEEDRPGSAPAVVLSHGFWTARFHADAAVIGRSVRLNGRDFTVVGVAPPAFRSPYYVGFAPSLWVPAGAAALLRPAAVRALETRGEVSARMIGRLRPGVTVAQAGRAVDAVVRRLAELYPATNADLRGVVLREQDARPEPEMAGQMGLALGLFLAVAGMVLLIACANVASLLLARAITRRREIAVRLALGAGRRRLVQQLLSESALLALAGGAAGLLLARWLSAAVTRLLHFATDIPFVFDFTLDQRVVLFTAVVTLVTTFAFGLVPALQASSPAVAGALKTEAVGWRGVHRSRLRSGLVVAQLAICCLLLVGAGLVVRTLGAMQRVGLGFDTRNALLLTLSPGLAGYQDARAAAMYRELTARVRLLTGVTGVTLADALPLEFTSNGGPLLAEGGELRQAEPAGEPGNWATVGPDYFATMGTALVEGRDFAAGDSAGAVPVAIVSRVAADRLWPGQAALGRVLRLGGADGPRLTVVGIAADAKYRNISESPRAFVYLPLAQNLSSTMTLVVRTSGDPLRALPAIRDQVVAQDPDLPISDVKTMDALVAGRALLLPRVGAKVTGALSLLALALAVVGLYGIVAYAVAQRTRELGIRMALGATAGGVVRLMLRDGLRLAMAGIALGLVAALALTRIARGLLFGVSPLDPAALGGTVLILALVTLAASWLPARRAARMDPLVALKSE